MKLDAPLTATVEQFKRISGLGKTSIYELIKAGDLRSVRICGRRLIVVDSYREWRSANKEPEVIAPPPKPPAPRQPKKPPPFVGDVIYFVEAPSTSLIKIGTTRYIGSRIRALQSASPVKLRFLGCMAGTVNAERELHERFARHRKHGEWFSASAELRRFINAALASRGLPVNG